ncbi:hypothetical protein FEDK69T_26610 [Flavobacterium enshiense DK69]|nr:hypothetical protein FEDK69T_26610 [Flavobacterium enshiense DK69]
MAMESKHEKMVNVTKRITLFSLGLMLAVRYFDKGELFG